MKKQFEHNEIETCRLCKKPINTNLQDWVALIDYSGKKQINIGFYHNFCLDDLIKGQGQVIKKRFEEQLKNTVGGLVGNIKQQLIH